ncbi:MAG: hypothetical protein QNJ63_05455, partial [Calothrix sp. MO_192.B10]|nr:hypothetical protein [Calothrix sp. MO_192.B10]
MTKSLKPKGLIAAFIPDVNDPQTTNLLGFVVFISGFSASRPYKHISKSSKPFDSQLFPVKS